MLRVLKHKGAASAGVDLGGRLCFFCFSHVIREIAHRVGSCASEAGPCVDGLSCDVEPGGTFEGCTHTRQRRRAALSSLLSTATVHRDYKGLLPHRDSTKCQPWPESANAPQNKRILLSSLTLLKMVKVHSAFLCKSPAFKVKSERAFRGPSLNSLAGVVLHTQTRGKHASYLSPISLYLNKAYFPSRESVPFRPHLLTFPNPKVRLGLLFKKWLAHSHSFSYLTNAWIHFLPFLTCLLIVIAVSCRCGAANY